MLHKTILILGLLILASPAMVACGSDEPGTSENDPENNNQNNENNNGTNANANANNGDVECTPDSAEPNCDPGFSCINAECVEDPECTMSSECGEGFSCIDQECVEDPECTDTSECGDGFSCIDQECVENPECETSDECDEGFSCIDQECVETPTCSDADDCEEGFSCVNQECVEDPECQVSDECDEGFSCIDQECVEDPECTLNEHCDAGYSCVNQECVEDPECTIDAQCDDGYSCVNQQCEEDAPECSSAQDCGEGFDCVDGDCVIDDQGPDPTDAELCDEYCHLIYGCMGEECTGFEQSVIDDATDECINGTSDGSIPGCLEDVTDDETRDAYIEFVYTDEDGDLSDTPNSCDASEFVRCGLFGIHDFCGCTPPGNLGDSCGADDECDHGSLGFSQCIDNDDFPGGYCIAGECARFAIDGEAVGLSADGGCGVDAGCLDGGDIGYCVDLCDSHDECAGDLSCQILDVLYDDINGEVVSVDISRICAAQCEDDDECGDAARCNSDTGACEFPCEDEDDEDLCGFVNGECTDDGGTEWCVMQ